MKRHYQHTKKKTNKHKNILYKIIKYASFNIFLTLFFFFSLFCLYFLCFSLSNSASFSDLQYFSRRAAAIAAAAAAGVALPPPPSSSTNQQGSSANGVVGSTTSPAGAGPQPPPPSLQHDFHPAYRIPGYMEHLYSLQHAAATGSPNSSTLHGKFGRSIGTHNSTAQHFTLHGQIETNTWYIRRVYYIYICLFVVIYFFRLTPISWSSTTY